MNLKQFVADFPLEGILLCFLVRGRCGNGRVWYPDGLPAHSSAHHLATALALVRDGYGRSCLRLFSAGTVGVVPATSNQYTVMALWEFRGLTIRDS
jgi:hypothetical protein